MNEKTENVKPPEKKSKHKQTGKLFKDWFQAREIYAWFQFKSGRTREEIGKELNLGTRQITRLTKRIEAALNSQCPIKDYRDICFVSNIYKALDNVGKLLHRGDIRMTIEFLKGMGIFKEYAEVERKQPPQSPEELREKLKRDAEAYGYRFELNGAGTNRISPFISGSKPPQKHEGGAA